MLTIFNLRLNVLLIIRNTYFLAFFRILNHQSYTVTRFCQHIAPIRESIKNANALFDSTTPEMKETYLKLEVAVRT